MEICYLSSSRHLIQGPDCLSIDVIIKAGVARGGAAPRKETPQWCEGSAGQSIWL